MIRLTIRQLEYFEALAETLHFGRAAALAGVTQPALSAQVAEMEQRLGCRLFERGARTVTLTDEARALKPRIEQVLAGLRDIEASARQERGALEGRFRLGMIPTVAPYLLPRFLPLARERFPGLAIELREAVTDVLIEETLNRRLDGFVAALPLDHAGLTATALFDDRFYLAVPPGDPTFVDPPVAPESPALERLMLLEEGHCMREQALEICGRVRPAAMANYGATSLTTLLHMVSHGHGVTLIPQMAAGTAGPEVMVVPFSEPTPSRTICLARRRDSARQFECQALAGLMAGLGRSDGAGEM